MLSSLIRRDVEEESDHRECEPSMPHLRITASHIEVRESMASDAVSSEIGKRLVLVKRLSSSGLLQPLHLRTISVLIGS